LENIGANRTLEKMGVRADITHGGPACSSLGNGFSLDWDQVLATLRASLFPPVV